MEWVTDSVWTEIMSWNLDLLYALSDPSRCDSMTSFSVLTFIKNCHSCCPFLIYSRVQFRVGCTMTCSNVPFSASGAPVGQTCCNEVFLSLVSLLVTFFFALSGALGAGLGALCCALLSQSSKYWLQGKELFLSWPFGNSVWLFWSLIHYPIGFLRR